MAGDVCRRSSGKRLRSFHPDRLLLVRDVRIWGTAARSFFKFVVKCAGSEGTRAAELYHWSAMTFGEHWRRLVAVELGRGRLSCLRRAADRGYGGNSVPSAETAPDSL